MTRQKKSRKQGSGSSGPKKLEKAEQLALKEKRVRKKSGKVAGSRQQEHISANDKNQQNTVKDPRIGSKKPIVLIKTAKVDEKIKPKKQSEIAEIRVVEKAPEENSLATQLAMIEQDSLLLDILEKQDEGIELSEQEVEHFNKLMERHEIISERLAAQDNDDVEEEISSKTLSEDELFDKFNNSDFISDFDNKE
jgi:ribosome assembly protein YihI (activator of Der GTPase)